ncbi:PLC-like phosphodiesterase [Leptodontidium sp. MPI-SDFR-AT-0119]|nr:PLC-like phosphodiesterase [Leptodontidium sp. MPI-SDFR-AT-0119]
MPSKGVQCYSYVAVPGCQIEFSVPGTNLIRNEQKRYFNDHLEVDKKNIKGPFNFSGTFSFRVTQNGNEIANEKISINVLTGNLEGGTLKTMANQASIVKNDVIVSYGYYDAGPGVAGLPSSDQCYVTMFLPAAHDVGMNSMQSSDAVISSDALVNVLTSIDPVFAKIAGMMAHPAVMAIAPNIVRGLAITQKDSLQTMLSIGARYFEFRPAYLHNVIRGKTSIPDVLYFAHSAIPGMPFAEFLGGVVSFLVAHPDEIVVTQLRWDGVPAECGHPSGDDISRYMSTALGPTNGGIVQGSLDDMLRLSIADLRSQRKRLILFTPSDSFSTYTDSANATLNGDSIIAEFNKISPQVQAGKPFTNLQCQATATNVPEAVAYSVLAANASSSCLLATKPICDAKTLPWIQANASRLDANQLVVVMNDFLDGATADVSIDWCRKRLA